MQLRNGKIKPLISKCYKCNEFYGNKAYKYQCSGCYNGLKTIFPWKNEEFREKVNEWAKEQFSLAIRINARLTLEHIVKISYYQTNDKESEYLLKSCIEALQLQCKAKGGELFISAKNGEKILRTIGLDCEEKSHLICPLIVDWWNMKNYNFNAMEMCYYGRFGDSFTFAEEIRSIPPPRPNRRYF